VAKYGTALKVIDNNIIRRMLFACRIIKAINTNSEYVIIIFSYGNNVYAKVIQRYVTRLRPVLLTETLIPMSAVRGVLQDTKYINCFLQRNSVSTYRALEIRTRHLLWEIKQYGDSTCDFSSGPNTCDSSSFPYLS